MPRSRVAAKGAVRTIDVGRVSYTGGDGRETSRLYCNIASAGLTGVAAERINRSSKRLGATVAFAWGAVVTFFGYHNSRFHIRIDDRELDRVCNNVIVGNCRYFASGMKILPMAEPDDGLLDVLVWGDVGKVDLALNLHRLYRGTHINHPKADFSRGTRVVVEPETPLPIEADGEQPGVTPVTFEIVPAAIRLRVPRRADQSPAAGLERVVRGLAARAAGTRLARSLTAASMRSSDAWIRATSSRVAR